MSNEPNTRLTGMKQDIQDTRTKFTQSLPALLGWTDEKLQNINSQLANSKHDLTKNMEDIVNDMFFVRPCLLLSNWLLMFWNFSSVQPRRAGKDWVNSVLYPEYLASFHSV